MSAKEVLSRQFTKCFDEDGWFVGTKNAIANLTAEQAEWKPDGADNSIREIIQHLNRIRPPFNTNSLAQKGALAALEDEEHVQESRRMNLEGRQFLLEQLQALKFTVVPSQANFLYFDAHQDGKPLFDALLRQGVIVRHLGGTFLRVTIGLPEENQRFIGALQSVLSQKERP